jgi:hypothetical protein
MILNLVTFVQLILILKKPIPWNIVDRVKVWAIGRLSYIHNFTFYHTLNFGTSAFLMKLALKESILDEYCNEFVFI